MYRVEPVGDDVEAAIDALPVEFLGAFTELRAALEVSPWTVGGPYVASNPTGSRRAVFGPGGRGLLIYGVRERDRLVVLWQLTTL